MKEKPTSKAQEPVVSTSAEFRHFLAECEQLVIAYNHFSMLYEDADKRNLKKKLRLLEKTAHYFFYDLQRILIGSIYLNICRITDVSKIIARKEVRYNLTINYFMEFSDLTSIERKRSLLQKLVNQMNDFRKKTEKSRNRRISHIDREAAISGEDLDGFSPKEFAGFMGALQEYVDIFNDFFFSGPRPLDFQAGAEDLLDALLKSTYYDQLRGDPSFDIPMQEIEDCSNF